MNEYLLLYENCGKRCSKVLEEPRWSTHYRTDLNLLSFVTFWQDIHSNRTIIPTTITSEIVCGKFLLYKNYVNYVFNFIKNTAHEY